MSSWGLRHFLGVDTSTSVSQRRAWGLDLGLNLTPPSHNNTSVELSLFTDCQEVQASAYHGYSWPQIANNVDDGFPMKTFMQNWTPDELYLPTNHQEVQAAEEHGFLSRTPSELSMELFLLNNPQEVQAPIEHCFQPKTTNNAPTFMLPPRQCGENRNSGRLTLATFCQEVQAVESRCSCRQTTNNVEVFDDEVAVISPMEFAEAKANSERNRTCRMREVPAGTTHTISRSAVVITSSSGHRGTVADQTPPEASNKKTKNDFKPEELPQVPQPDCKANSFFTCPICMGHLVEPTSTKCGHIFCKGCIERSLKTWKQTCPTCRQKVTKRGGLFRIYLPATSTE